MAIVVSPYRPIFLRFSLLALLFLCIPLPGFGQAYFPGSTRKMFQVTGDFDNPLRRPTKSLTWTQAGVRGTDLGSTFEHKGKLYFLFGDTVGPSVGGRDTFAHTTATIAADLHLTFPLDHEGDFTQIRISGIGTGGMCVPSGGISYNDVIYVIFTTQWYAADGNMEKSFMIKSTDDGATWTRLYPFSEVGPNHSMSNTHFINASLSIVNSSDWPGLPYEGDNLLVYGSGAYRKSSVYLAAMPADSIENRDTIRYLTGVQAGVPVWGQTESQAMPLFIQPTVGEFSCYWIPQLEKWVMLYNASSPRGITMRTADQPWGIFSTGQIIMDPWEFYGRMMHISWSGWGHFDAFHDGLMGGANVWGGEYGPYLIPRFITGDKTSAHLYYTLSTWNPYQVVLMRSEVGAVAPVIRPVSSTTKILPGSEGWMKTGGDWFRSFTHDNSPWITTHASGNADQGIMYTWLPRDEWNHDISFSIHGGEAEVLLIEGGGDIPVTGDIPAIYAAIKAGAYGDVVQCTWGHRSNAIDIPVTWSLLPFDRANMKIVVIDHLASAWGFVSVSEMTLKRNEPGAGLQVFLLPQEAVAKGARWRLNGGAWRISGFSLYDLPPGDHHLEFGSADGHRPPPDQILSLSSGENRQEWGIYQPIVNQSRFWEDYE